MRVNIEYEFARVQMEDVVTKISQVAFAHVVIWYIGINGLKKQCADFYKNFLIDPLLKSDHSAFFWMLDLTAWKSLVNKKISFTKRSRIANRINDCKFDRFNCILSADIFDKMKNICDEVIINYFNKSLRKEFIWESSRGQDCSEILVGEVFERDCCLLEEWFSIDTCKFYSVLQYLEFLFIIEKIILSLIEKDSLRKRINIIFALPNDELKYYFDEENSLEKDLKFFLKKTCGALLKDREIHIQFLSFQYGSELHHRPYNSPGEILKSSQFVVSDYFS